MPCTLFDCGYCLVPFFNSIDFVPLQHFKDNVWCLTVHNFICSSAAMSWEARRQIFHKFLPFSLFSSTAFLWRGIALHWITNLWIQYRKNNARRSPLQNPNHTFTAITSEYYAEILNTRLRLNRRRTAGKLQSQGCASDNDFVNK